jgi:hypothetical protein
MNTTTEPLKTPNIYIPKIVRAPIFGDAIRVGIQGYPGTGKTHSGLTFPNPIVADFDNNLTPEQKKLFPSIPFWDDEYVTNTLKSPAKSAKHFANKRDALKTFLRTEATGLSSEQTLILDSWTAIQEAIDNQNDAEPEYTKEGKLDEYAFWRKKLEESKDIMNLLRALKCNVVVTFHEMSERDPKSGQLLDKIRPLQQGKFLSEIGKNFTFFFRAITDEEKDKEGKVVKTTWWWQVSSDSKFDAIARPAFPEGVFKVEPRYETLSKLMKGEFQTISTPK